jgi:hypothetical protein
MPHNACKPPKKYMYKDVRRTYVTTNKTKTNSGSIHYYILVNNLITSNWEKQMGLNMPIILPINDGYKRLCILTHAML